MRNRKKILIVASTFYPVNSPRSFRTTELAKELIRQGHDVKVLTPFHPEHAAFAQVHSVTLKDLGQPKWPTISIYGTGILLMIRRAARRISNWLLEYPDLELLFLVSKALRREGGYDALISIAVPYPVHWGVARRWNTSRKGCPARVWIADCGDPFMGQENDTFTPPFYFAWVEKWFMRKADHITVPVATAISAYYPEFHEKIKVIPQGFRFEDYQEQTKQPQNEYPTFAYGGVFIPDRRDPKELIQYLADKTMNFEFHIFTTTPHIPQKWIPDGDKRFIIHKPLPREKFLMELANMDFVVNFDNVGSKQIPSKLIDYTILNKPILSIKTHNLDIKKVNQFLNRDYSQKLVVDNPQQYRIENVAQQFLKLLEE